MSAENDVGPSDCLPLAVVEVVPLHLPDPRRSSRGTSNDRSSTPADISNFHLGPPPPPLSAPMVKMQLRRLTAASMAGSSRMSSGGGSCAGRAMRILLDRDRGDEVANEGTDDHLSKKLESISLDADTRPTSKASDDTLNEKLQSLSLDTDTPIMSMVQTHSAKTKTVSGDMFLSNATWRGTIEKQLGLENTEQAEDVPITRLLSDDPTDHSDGVPCWLRGYAQVTAASAAISSHGTPYTREVMDCAVMNGTLVRILPPIPARILRKSNGDNDGRGDASRGSNEAALVRSRTAYEGHPRTECGVPLPLPLFTELSGEVDTYQLSRNAVNDSDFILACHDDETVRALLVRMQALLDRVVMVGTTEDAVAMWEAKVSRGRRRRRTLETYYSKQQQSTKAQTTTLPADHSPSSTDADVCSNLFRDGALTVHNQYEASGKTRLVQTLARHVLACSAVHTFDATTLFAKYGANGADAALESLLHSVVLSAAVGGGRIIPGQEMVRTTSSPSICIILDNLESFAPPSMSGKGRSIGDPALPALNSMVAYLTKVTNSIKNKGQFPFPTKNPMYNLSGSRGYAIPVRICIVGIITCDDDGGRKGIDAPGDSYSVLDVLGSNRYRLPPPSSKTRYQAFLRAFEEEHIHLSADASVELPIIAASTTSARGREFCKVAKHLSSNLVDKETGKSREATAFDIREAMNIVSRDAPKDTSIAVTFLSSKTGRGAAAALSLSKGGDIFASVGGNTEAKIALEDALALDPRKRRILSAFGLSPPIGVLLYGPPGTGKTLLAKATALALESESPIGGAFINIRATDIVRGEVGRSEKLLVSSFELARANTPAVVFIDEFQSLFTERGGTGSSQLASTLLQCMDDVSRWRKADALVEKKQKNEDAVFDVGKGRIIVLGATNVPWMIDKAFLRPGRFDRVVHVGLPNLEERESILRVHVCNMRICAGTSTETTKEEICKHLARETEGLSGADLFALCRMAVIRCVNDKTSAVDAGVKEQHFLDALKHDVVPSCSHNFVRKLLRWSPRGNSSM